ncbi:flavin reductase [Microlunatus elymi]|uniref:Flavin reductase n=2 Tax=Microlunatus elymi TaxID=2596828 RepID=A0A516Q5Q2_9ACTN|nr:flavin reductase [Microlunatus elymi]
MRPLSTEEFDEFVEDLDYPLFVVTADDGTERGGCLVGFATQVSIDPPRLLVCLSEQNHTLRIAAGAEFLAVHTLGDDDHGLAELFGGETGDEIDKFARVRWHPGPGGVPLLDDLPRYVVGRVLQRLPLGDHVGQLLMPVAAEARKGADDEALTVQDVEDLEPGHPA